jgi:hypothetical protein
VNQRYLIILRNLAKLLAELWTEAHAWRAQDYSCWNRQKHKRSIEDDTRATMHRKKANDNLSPLIALHWYRRKIATFRMAGSVSWRMNIGLVLGRWKVSKDPSSLVSQSHGNNGTAEAGEGEAASGVALAGP